MILLNTSKYGLDPHRVFGISTRPIADRRVLTGSTKVKTGKGTPFRSPYLLGSVDLPRGPSRQMRTRLGADHILIGMVGLLTAIAYTWLVDRSRLWASARPCRTVEQSTRPHLSVDRKWQKPLSTRPGGPIPRLLDPDQGGKHWGGPNLGSQTIKFMKINGITSLDLTKIITRPNLGRTIPK